MIGRIIALGLLWALAPRPGFAAQPTPVSQLDFGRDIGLFAANSQGKFCLLIANGALKPGQEIVLVWVPVEGEPYKPEIRRGKVVAKLAAPCDDINAQAGDSSYRLEAGKLDNGRIYIAIAARPRDLRLAGRQVSARLGNRQISFRSCTTMEGVHFSAWSGTPPKEQSIWSRGFYLGYDVEPTCVERDIKEIKP